MTSRNPAEGAARAARTAVFLALVTIAFAHSDRVAAHESAAPFDAPLVVLPRLHVFRYTGDVDGDAYPDALATWGHDSQVTVIVLSNDGQGGFFERCRASFPRRPQGVFTFTAGDLDGDGLLDWAVGVPDRRGEKSTVSLYLNRGDGVCSLWREYDEDPHLALLIDDLDGDGPGEIISCSRSTQGCTLRIRRNVGVDEPFRILEAQTADLAEAHLTAGEVTGDGIRDILLGAIGGVRVFAVGESSITQGETFAYGTQATSGDVDGDGDTDVLLHSSRDSYRVARRVGPATFDLEPPRSGGPVTNLVDVDGDGDLDGVGSGDFGTFLVSHNLGGGEFTRAFSFPGLESDGIAGAIDVDLDGDVDLVGGRCVYYARGPLHSDPYLRFQEPSWERPALVDYDGDGDPDLMHYLDTILTNDGTGAFRPGGEVLPAPPAGTTFGRGVTAGDFDGDGDLDLLTEQWQDQVFLTMRLLTNTGGGSFVDAGAAGPPGVRFGYLAEAHVVDIDGDGDADLLAKPPGWSGRIYLNDGSGFFPDSLELERDEIGEGAEDLDGDGITDLVVGGLYSPMSLRRGLGGGTFAPAERLPATLAEEGRLEIADFDGNGTLDLAGFSHEGSFSLLLNDGTGTFTRYPVPGVANYWDLLQVGTVMADVNGDGNQDLVIFPAGSTRNTVQILLGAGPGLGFTEGPIQMIKIARGADIDGDGDVDLVNNDGIVRNHLIDGPSAGMRIQFRSGLPGTGGMTPVLGATGPFRPGSQITLHVRRGRGAGKVWILAGRTVTTVPWSGGTIYTDPIRTIEGVLAGPRGMAGAGSLDVPAGVVPASHAGAAFTVQAVIRDPRAVQGYSMTQALRITIGE